MDKSDFDFDTQEVDVDALADIGTDHQLPRDREMESIRRRKVYRSQFGMRQILALIVLVALVCALPELVGWDPDMYAGLLMLVSLFFAPTIGFIVASIANVYGFNERQRTIIGWGGGFLAATVPIITFGTYTNFGLADYLFPVLFWIPQLALTVYCKWLFKIEPRVKRFHDAPSPKVD